MAQHEVSEGWIGRVKLGKGKGESTNYFMWLTIDGQKQRRATGTERRRQGSGHAQRVARTGDGRPSAEGCSVDYEEIRDDYLTAHKMQDSGSQGP